MAKTTDDNREMIERVLGRCAEYPYRECCKAHRLTEQAIVIECEVEHKHLEHPYKPIYNKDVTYIRGGENNDWKLVYNGTHGTPGKAIAIIVPLEKDK